MTTIPKPQNCDQNWLDMKPTEGGRICGQCNKKIFDFTEMSWSQIEAFQKENGNAACGMYNPRQLDNWGQELSSSPGKLGKAVAITGLSVSVAFNALSQTSSETDSLVFTGTIITKETGIPVQSANVFLRTLNSVSITDQNGKFFIQIENLPEGPVPDTLDVVFPGYDLTSIPLEDLKNSVSDLQIEISLPLVIRSDVQPVAIYYSVRAPSRTKKVKWRIRNLFRKWN